MADESIIGLVVLVVLCCGVLVGGTISVNGSICGQKTCKVGQYCTFDKACESCAQICNASHHNFEKQLCEEKCQDYLHDARYVHKEDYDDLKGTVGKLSSMVSATLTLVCFMLIILGCLLCFQLYRWKVKKNITLEIIRNKIFGSKGDNVDSPSSNSVGDDNKKRDLRLEMPSPTVHSGNSPVTVSTSISRRPAEDSTLDYAYDNPAMAKTPNSSF
ncbi:protein grindelwald [Cylas formicarius]|uniref:protein grindelwald n=1 Tax=Cylas formicarius TaxID=197179 RepID=UPI00295896FA|nr:protein grindelwald [Cylas formicarius]